MSHSQIIWERADLISWGEFYKSPFGEYRKLWKFHDNVKNEDGCVFELQFEGATIAAGIDYPATDEAENHINGLVAEHMEKLETQIRTSWSKVVPCYDSFDGPHAYYWFRGGNYNRPVIVCLHKGGGINKGPSGESPPWRELNGEFPEQASHLWRPHWPSGEWSGPIAEPQSALAHDH